ncbi:hypothetical protein D3C87_834640 [compost metagenome]
MAGFEHGFGIARQRGAGRIELSCLHIGDIEGLTRPVDDRIVAPGRQLIVARIAAPAETGAFGRNVEAETLVRDDVDPRMRCGLPAIEAHNIFLAVLGEAAKTVPEIEITRIFDLFRNRKGRNRQTGLRSIACAIGAAMGRKQRDRTVDLVDNLAVAHVENNARSGEKRAPRLFVHQVAAHGEDVRTTAIGGIDAALRLGNMIQRMLHVLCIGCSPFVDDNEIEDHAA